MFIEFIFVKNVYKNKNVYKIRVLRMFIEFIFVKNVYKNKNVKNIYRNYIC